jgi:hypothetical protein
MQPKSQKMRWKPFEEDLLKSFLQTQRPNLIINMYKNIAAGQLRFRRETKLFQEMSKVVGRTSLQCKSKMQKFERHAYVQFLRVKPSHYDVFEWLRKKRSLKMRRRRKGKLGVVCDDLDFKVKRKRVLEEILNGSFELNGNFVQVKQNLGFDVEDFLSWIEPEKSIEDTDLVDRNNKSGSNDNGYSGLGSFQTPNNNFENSKKSCFVKNKLDENHEQNFLKKLAHVPSLKISHFEPANKPFRKKPFFDFQITEMKMKISQENQPIIEKSGKRPEPKWIRVPPKILNPYPLKRIFYSPFKLRKDTKDTCLSNESLSLEEDHSKNLTNGQKLNHENSIKTQNENDFKITNEIFSSPLSMKFNSNKTIESVNFEKSNYFDEFNNNKINSDCKESKKIEKSTNTLQDLLNDLVATSDKMPQGSNCRKRLMSLVQKYRTQNFKSLEMH